MNADGTVNREQVRSIDHRGRTREIRRDGHYEGATRPAGVSVLAKTGRAATVRRLRLDVADLNTASREVFAKYPPRQDNRDDAAIVQRYFPECLWIRPDSPVLRISRGDSDFIGHRGSGPSGSDDIFVVRRW
jgi:hypothetical protein